MDSAGLSSSQTRGAIPCSSSSAALFPALLLQSSASAQAARSTEGGWCGMAPVSGVVRCSSLRGSCMLNGLHRSILKRASYHFTGSIGCSSLCSRWLLIISIMYSHPCANLHAQACDMGHERVVCTLPALFCSADFWGGGEVGKGQPITLAASVEHQHCEQHPARAHSEPPSCSGLPLRLPQGLWPSLHASLAYFKREVRGFDRIRQSYTTYSCWRFPYMNCPQSLVCPQCCIMFFHAHLLNKGSPLLPRRCLGQA